MARNKNPITIADCIVFAMFFVSAIYYIVSALFDILKEELIIISVLQFITLFYAFWYNLMRRGLKK